MTQVGVIDLGAGNLYSVLRGLERAGGTPTLVRTREEIALAPRLVLPGVGSFADASHRLQSLDLSGPIRDAAARGTPLLGICLGMQILFEEGDEDGLNPGLGLLRGRVTRLKGGPGLTIPHMGWQRVSIRGDSALLSPADEQPWFWFSHSYRALATDSDITAIATHGEEIPAVVSHGRVFGIQPHPEKSGAAGQTVLRRFLSVV